MPTIEDFDDDTDFALPTPPPTSGPSASSSSSSSGGMPAIPGMPELTPEQMQAFQKMMQGAGGGSNPMAGMGMSAPQSSSQQQQQQQEATGESKHWLTLYPIYFSTKYSHKIGQRRVAWRQSCLFPHSLGIAKSVSELKLKYVHEAGKFHPREWENPGRVKVQVFDDEGKPLCSDIKNKQQLVNAVAKYMQQYCGGPPPVAVPKRQKKVKEVEKKGDDKKQVAAPTVKDKKTSAPPQAAQAPATKPSRSQISPGTSARASHLHRARLLQPYMPPTHIRLPPHSPSISADFLNMDMDKAVGKASTAGDAPGQPNPMKALGSMMGNLGFGQEDQDDEESKQAEEDKRKQNDPYRGMGRRGRKRVVRVGR